MCSSSKFVKHCNLEYSKTVEVSPFQLNNVISFQLDVNVDKLDFLEKLKRLVTDERLQLGDENFVEESLIDQVEGKRLKLEDTNLIR